MAQSYDFEAASASGETETSPLERLAEIAARTAEETGRYANVDAIMRIPVTMQVVLGSATIPVANLMKLGRGAVVPLDHKVGDLTPPARHRRIGPPLPRHLPPRLRAGQGPRDCHDVRAVVEPDGRTDENVAQLHAAPLSARDVARQVRVDESLCATRDGDDPVDDEHLSHG